MKIAFDIDGTLDAGGSPNKWVHGELLKFEEQGHEIIVWSGGGVDYAKRYVNRHNLPARVVIKCSEDVDIAFDDVATNLPNAGLTITVPYL